MNKIILIIILLWLAVMMQAIEIPDIHSSIMLDGYFYNGAEAIPVYDNTNRFQIRKAALHFSGIFNERIHYGMEVGLATCVGSGDNIRLLEAEIMYGLSKKMSFGIRQGHVLRGFSYHTECSQRLSVEKPMYQASFAACHPLGIIAEGYLKMIEELRLQYEVAILNGSGGTLKGEHDYNLGVMIDTPINGLKLAASGSQTGSKYFDSNYQPYYKDGYRWLTGMEYRNNSIWLTTEYAEGKGFGNSDNIDQKMTAWYGQGGYAFIINNETLNKIEPWIKYEIWDKDSDSVIENEYHFLDAGINIYLKDNTMLRGAYRKLQKKPDYEVEKADEFILRLQVDF